MLARIVAYLASLVKNEEKCKRYVNVALIFLLEGRLVHRVESPFISLKQDKLWKFSIRFSGAKLWDSVDCPEIKNHEGT